AAAIRRSDPRHQRTPPFHHQQVLLLLPRARSGLSQIPTGVRRQAIAGPGAVQELRPLEHIRRTGPGESRSPELRRPNDPRADPQAAGRRRRYDDTALADKRDLRPRSLRRHPRTPEVSSSASAGIPRPRAAAIRGRYAVAGGSTTGTRPAATGRAER